MNVVFVLLALGFWIVLIIKDVFFSVVFGILFALYLLFKFHRISWVMIWLICLCFSFCLWNQEIKEPLPGEYTIYHIRQNYCLARSNGVSILIYGLEDPGFYDVFQINSFERIHSVKNVHLFCFEEYLKEDRIYYQSYVDSNQIIRKGHSLKSSLYHFFKFKDPYWASSLYGIHSDGEPELVSRLSLPILSLLLWVEKRLKRYISKMEIIYMIICLCALLLGSLFVFSVTLWRMILSRFSKCFFSMWEYQFYFTVFLFLILMPEKATSFGFVLPNLMILLYHLCHDPLYRFFSSKWLLIGLQYFYFQEVDFVMLILFGTLRKWSGMILLISFVCLFFAMDPFSYWNDLLEQIPSLVWKFQPNFIYLICWICTGVFLLCATKNIARKMFMVTMIIPFLFPYLDPWYTVSLFDVGQGDMTLITEPFHRSAVLIDCGERLNASSSNVATILYPYLQAKHIDHLDCVIITHEDIDHSGGLEQLKKMIPIDQVITSSTEKVNVDYPFYNLLEKRHAKDENDASIISYFKYDSLSYLWMGDAGVDVERQLIVNYPRLKVDILKLGHHGSNTSSSFTFLNSVEPRLGLISVGEANRYGHPHVEILERLAELGISNLKTSEVGMVQIRSLHGIAFFQTGSGFFGIMDGYR